MRIGAYAALAFVAVVLDATLAPQIEILGARQYRLDESLRTETQQSVQDLCARFPIP